MEKSTIYKIFYLISVMLILLCASMVIMDYTQYNESFSSPFGLYVLIRLGEFALPSILFLYIARKIRMTTKEK